MLNSTIKKHSNNPFDLNNIDAYNRWRDEKLNHYPSKAEQLVIEIKNPKELTSAERKAAIQIYKKTNMLVYISQTGTNPDKRNALQLAQQFNLKTLDNNMGADDGITSLQVSNIKGRERYIPYSNKAIHWHTDGYYNKSNKQIHALNLHCVRAAMHGGENAIMDHEIAYILLRDKNPDFIRAFMEKDAMIIPANIKDGKIIRPDRKGPVFSTWGDDNLHMRFTAREHNVIWKNTSETEAAVNALNTLLNTQNEYIYRLTLQSGWGLISNNVLHDRSGFEDDKDAPRLLYRLRYFEGLAKH